MQLRPWFPVELSWVDCSVHVYTDVGEWSAVAPVWLAVAAVDGRRARRRIDIAVERLSGQRKIRNGRDAAASYRRRPISTTRCIMIIFYSPRMVETTK